MTDSSQSFFQMSEDDMRTFGYQVVDFIASHYANIQDQPVGRQAKRSDMESLLRETAPEHSSPFPELLQQIQRDIAPNMMNLTHPRFFGYVSGPSNFISVLGDTLATALNPFMGTWQASSGAAMLELVTLDWMRDIMGMPESAGGLFVSGGSIANLTGLLAARHHKIKNNLSKAMVYCSDQTHASNDKALRVLGLDTSQIRRLPSDDTFRLDLAILQKQIQEDRDQGLQPFCVIANAGTTNTGAVDPLQALTVLCRENDLWLHADGAYGAGAMLCEQGRTLLQGIQEVDSLSFDPHKWMFQPYEIGCVLVRDKSILRDALEIRGDYMQTISQDEDRHNFCDYGIQLTRNFRALKLWLSIKTYGLDTFRQAVQRGIELSEFAESTIAGMSDWNIITKAQLGMLSFRFAPKSLTQVQQDEVNQAMVEISQEDGYMFVSSTTLKSQTVLRMNTINPHTTEQDITLSLQRLDSLARNYIKTQFDTTNPS